MSWKEFVLFGITPAGIGAIVGFVLSFIIEFVPKYEALSPRLKRLSFLGLSLAIPLALTALGVATGVRGAWADFQGTWWPSLVAGFTTYIGGQVAHTWKLGG